MNYTLCKNFSRLLRSLEINGFKKTARYCNGVSVQEVEREQVTPENQYECLAQVVTPLWQMPYNEQLKLKQDWCRSVLQNLRFKLSKVMKERRIGNLNCKIHQVKRSPVLEAYRNKDEFNVRTGVDGDPKTVGFFVGSPAEGTVVCVRGTHLINMKQSHKDVAQAYEDYIRSSPLPACHDFRDGGHWRSLVVRSNEAGQVMAVVVFHPRDMDVARLDAEAEKLRDYFQHGPGSRCNLTSLYFQPCPNTRCTGEQAPFKLLFGESHLVETLDEYKFQISPDSFFQVNRTAAAVMYRTALKLANLTPMTTLLDVCCGTGTVSILASHKVRGAVGVEAVQAAVTDARSNALLNNVNNVQFIAGLAEKIIPRVMKELDMATNLAAIVNPGRSGCHRRVIQALCSSPQIRYVVYISCKADSPNAQANFVQLCSEGRFSLTSVVPVDLFPHTHHTELVMCFRR